MRPGRRRSSSQRGDSPGVATRCSAVTDRLEREKAEGMVDAYWLYCRDHAPAQSGAPNGLLIETDSPDELAREARAGPIDPIVLAVDVCRQAREAILRQRRPAPHPRNSVLSRRPAGGIG